MTALGTTVTRNPHPVSKLLQVARHRVTRWFRPTQAELRRLRLEPHPHPTVPPYETSRGMEHHDDQVA